MRPDKDEWAVKLALVTSERSTCYRRSVGCVLLNARGHVIATGYNGVAAGLPHCKDDDCDYEYVLLTFGNDVGTHRCAGSHAPSGQNLDGCQAIHAEQNALLQCQDVYQIHTAYVTASPCVTCVKLLLNTACERIVYVEEYPHSDAQKLWEDSGRKWVKSKLS